MTTDEIRSILARKPRATEEYPFGPGAMVFKVGGKLFAIVGTEDRPLSVSLKCDPDEALALRSTYPSIQPGYHLNKRHWNTVALDSAIPNDLLHEMIDESYALVVQSLPKAIRDSLK
jgi:predicted DNA-binding protein (MmcQ/YjbR family)